MSERNRAVVALQFGDGSAITAFTSFSLRDSFTDPLGAYEFETRPLRTQFEEYRTKLAKGELVTVKLNSVVLGTYLIITVRRRYGRDGAIYSASCKSVLATPYEGMVDPLLSFKNQTDTPVSDIVLEALAPYGFDTLVGDEGANRAAITGKSLIGKGTKIVVSSLKARQSAAQDGETAYAFASREFNRLGVALRADWDGKLILEAPDYDQDPIYTLVADLDGSTAGDRMLDDFEIVDSNDGQYSECRIRGVASDDAGNTESGPPVATVSATDINPKRPAYRSHAAAFKPLIIKDKNARDKARCTSVAKLALGIRARNALSIECTVDGFISSTGRAWAPNTVVHVIIRQEGIDESWWILERTFTEDRDGGQKTRLKLLPLGALVLGDVPTG